MKSKLVVYIVIVNIGIVSLVTLALLVVNNRSSDVVLQSIVPNSEDTNNKSGYKNGNYSSKIEYVAAGATEDIKLNIVISNGKVVNFENIHSGYHHKSERFQNYFEGEIDAYVIGANIDNISLSRIGGASATTVAFMDAINEIKNEAKV